MQAHPAREADRGRLRKAKEYEGHMRLNDIKDNPGVYMRLAYVYGE